MRISYSAPTFQIELRELTDQMVSGTISAAGLNWLDDLLREDGNNLNYYLIYMDMCAQLQWEFRVSLPDAGQPTGLQVPGR